MKIFFGGIIQGSLQGKDIYSQDYREKIKSILRDNYSDIDVFDPFENHTNSIDYDDSQARDTFFEHLDVVNSSDLLIAFLPQASMGTAVEMWQAYHHNIPIITISPMATNWVIKLISTKNFETIDDFEEFIKRNDEPSSFSDLIKETIKIKESI